MAAHIVKPELLAQEIGQRASVNELAAVIQQPGDIRNGRRLRQRPLDLVLRVHAASMRCARSIVQLYLRVKGRASRLARLYHGDDDRPASLSELLPDNLTLLMALLDAAADQDNWADEVDRRVSHHTWAVKQTVGWVEARPPEEHALLIDSMLDDLGKEMEGMGAQNEEDDTLTDPYSGWPGRRILTTVLAELSERLTYRAFRSEERRVGKECRSRWSPY